MKGTLLICGGSMSDENIVWRHMSEITGDGGISVIPTASSVPEESGPGTAELFEEFTSPVHVIDVTINNPENANRVDLAQTVTSSDGVFFTGGDQRRLGSIYLNEDGSRAPVLEAIWEVLDRGGVIGGTSAGAACQSDPMLNGGSSWESLLDGPDPTGDTGVGWQPGLGFFPWGLIDQHHIARGRLARLAIAQQSTGVRFGYGIDENSAMKVDRSTGKGYVLSGQLLMLDTIDMTGGPGKGIGNIEFRFLQEGDRINYKLGSVEPADGRAVVAPVGVYKAEVDDIWDRGVFEEALFTALREKNERLELSDNQFAMTITLDEQVVASEEKRASLLSGTLTIDLLSEE